MVDFTAAPSCLAVCPFPSNKQRNSRLNCKVAWECAGVLLTSLQINGWVFGQQDALLGSHFVEAHQQERGLSIFELSNEGGGFPVNAVDLEAARAPKIGFKQVWKPAVV